MTKESFMKKTTRALVVVLISVICGLLLGYNFKKPNERMLVLALEEPSEWKKELLIDRFKARTTFFELSTSEPFIGDDGNQYYAGWGSFHFNWLAFFIGATSIILLYVLMERTMVLELIKSRIKPYLR